MPVPRGLASSSSFREVHHNSFGFGWFVLKVGRYFDLYSGCCGGFSTFPIGFLVGVLDLAEGLCAKVPRVPTLGPSKPVEQSVEFRFRGGITLHELVLEAAWANGNRFLADYTIFVKNHLEHFFAKNSLMLRRFYL